MEIGFQRKNTTLIVALNGEIDHHSAGRFRQKIETELMKMNGRNVIFNFSNVDFMDSSGIGLVIGRYKYTTALGGKTAVVCSNEKINDIFKLSGICQIISVFNTVQEALNSIEGRAQDAV